MHIPATAAPSLLQSVLQQLDAHDSVSLSGSRSAPVVRWARHRRVLYVTCLGVLGLGVLCMVGGILLRDIGVWSLLVPAGFVLAFTATIAVGAAALNSRLMRDRLSAETEPVVLDAQGITLRDIGPIPWGDVGPPERRLVRVKTAISQPPATAGMIEILAPSATWASRPPTNRTSSSPT